LPARTAERKEAGPTDVRPERRRADVGRTKSFAKAKAVWLRIAIGSSDKGLGRGSRIDIKDSLCL